MSTIRRPPGPVRQLSLQQPPRRQQVRRQRSAEDEKQPLQVFANPIRTRLNCTDTKLDLDRPKVRVAWDENSGSGVSNGSVAVIARQIPGKLRPPTAKSKATNRPVINEKASILYSRQELTERLRLAWKQREENRANIDIFLAHNAVENNCESRPSSCATSATHTRTRDDEKVSENRNNGNSRIIINNSPIVATHSIRSVRVIQSREENEENLIKPSNQKSPERENSKNNLESEIPTRGTSSSSLEASDQESSKDSLEKTDEIKADVKSIDEIISDELCKKEDTNFLVKESKTEDSDTAAQEVEGVVDWSQNIPSALIVKERKKHQENISKDSLSSVQTTTVVSNAKIKRANFSNNSFNGNKIFTSGPSPVQISERRERQTIKEQNSIALPLVQSDTRTRRTNSAPPINQRIRSSSTSSSSLNNSGVVRTQVSIVIDTPSIGGTTHGGVTTLGNHEIKSELAVGGVQQEGLVKASISSNRTIKSAPIKRRTKSGKRRSGLGIGLGGIHQGVGVGSGGGVVVNGSCEIEEDINDQNIEGKQRKSFGKNRQTLQTKVPDVVTMVSLVSSADSDSDIDQNSPRDDKLIHELRNKLPTTPIIKTSASCCPAITAVLRKPIKSVSFQQESFDVEKEDVAKEDNRKWGVIGVFGQQKYPVVCRSGGSALPTPEEANIWRSEDATTTTTTTATTTTTIFSSSSSSITITRNNESNNKESEETILTPVTDREKRCLAVPIGDPIRDKKRRLLRTRSTPPGRPYGHSEDGSNNISGNNNAQINSTPVTNEMTGNSRNRENEGSSNDRGNITFPGINSELPVVKIETKTTQDNGEIILETDNRNFASTSSEPKFQTTKERECWHLYKRMCDKGVYVSFDTVLRGMLTPTEYRLRQKETAPATTTAAAADC